MTPERILLVQLADIGDLILSTPAMSTLRAARPEAHLALLTTTHSAPVVEGTGLVDEIIRFERKRFNSSRAFFQPGNLRRVFNLRSGHYDTLVFFHHFTLKAGTPKFALIALATGAKRRVGLENGNGWFLTDRVPDSGFGEKHQAEYWLELVGLLGADTQLRKAVVTTDLQVSAANPVPAPARRVVIHPGGGGYSLARRWDAPAFAAVADRLQQEHGAQIVLVGGPNDNGEAVRQAMKSDLLDLTGKTSLPQLAGVLESADLFIGAESGVMHLAAASGTPTLAIFGPGNPDAWGPWTPESHSVVLRSRPECSPCSYVGHGVGLREGCVAHTCMRMVTVEKVVKAAGEMLDGQAVKSMPSPQRQPAFPRRIRILSIPVDAITYAEWLELIGQWIAAPLPEGRFPYHICTVNPEFMMIAQQDPNFYNILQRADICIPDGVGLLWAARRLGSPLPERVTGSDGVPKIAERAAQHGWRLYFLGAAPGVAEKAAAVLQERYPGLQVAGTYSGSPAAEDEDAIVVQVNASHADILFVAYGAPIQDKWIARNLPRLQVKAALGVGGSFDFIAGIIPRAPLWMQRMGIEWLFRLYLQPSRIGRMMRLPRFVLAVLRRSAN